MRYEPQSLIVSTQEPFGRRVPIDLCDRIFRSLSPMFGHSVRMAVEGTSASVGAPPAWLRRAGDVRVLGFDEYKDNTLLNVEAPILGEAAEELYAQDELWPSKPDPTETAVNIFAKALQDVCRANPESQLYDRHLLKRFSSFNRVFERGVLSVGVPLTLDDHQFSARMDEHAVRNARELSDRTPPPQAIRITGKLDMIRHSTRSFGLVTDDGNEVRGVFETQDWSEETKEYLGKRVLVLGKAVFRPSGSLLRIDVAAVEGGEGQPLLFAKLPKPRAARPEILRSKPSDKYGVAAFFGTWPGEESEEDFESAVREIRH
jgi:hypothetical protein